MFRPYFRSAKGGQLTFQPRTSFHVVSGGLMKLTNSSLVAVLALSLGASLGCKSEEEPSGVDTESTGGKSGATGGKTGTGTGGTTAQGGSTGSTGGSSGSTGGSSGSTGGSSGSTGGSSGSTGSTGGSTGAGGSTGGDASAAETGGPVAGGEFKITVEQGPPDGDHKCFKPAASNKNGNHSPQMDWTTPPAGTKSLVLTTYDLNGKSPHQFVCNISPDVMGRPADVKAEIPPGAEVGYGFNGKPFWFGPGASGDAHAYLITVWALATDKLEGGCKGDTAFVRAAYAKLAAAKDNKAVVLGSASETLWGNVDGSCR
jgi:phosphatidylethanolamine-binding protein (PEBP) family uncharacterized protein